MALLILGFCEELTNPFGPVQDQLGVPDVVVLAVKLMVPPLQIGLLLVRVGVEGGDGSTSVTGPTVFDGQPATDIT